MDQSEIAIASTELVIAQAQDKSYPALFRFHSTVCLFEIWKKAFKLRSQETIVI